LALHFHSSELYYYVIPSRLTGAYGISRKQSSKDEDEDEDETKDKAEDKDEAVM